MLNAIGGPVETADLASRAMAVGGVEGVRFVERVGYEGLVIDIDAGRTATPRFPFAA